MAQNTSASTLFVQIWIHKFLIQTTVAIQTFKLIVSIFTHFFCVSLPEVARICQKLLPASELSSDVCVN